MRKLIFINLLLAWGLMGCADSSSEKHEIQRDAISDSAGIVGAEAFSNEDRGRRATVAIINTVTQQPFCTGTLITPRLVLTAAHCVDRFGSYAVQFHDGTVIASDLNLRHSGYGLSENEDDIALLRLAKAAPSSIKVALLPRTPLKPGSHKTRAFGIGRTGANIYDSGEMRMVNLQGSVSSSRPKFLQYLQSNGKGVCKGDSGGPHFMYSKGQPILVAITTQAENTRTFWGSQVADYCRRTTIATLTGRYFDWISQASKALVP